jgi:hypothetical protein
MTHDDQWQDWTELAAADLADPAFRSLVAEVDVDQQAWADEDEADEPGRDTSR